MRPFFSRTIDDSHTQQTTTLQFDILFPGLWSESLLNMKFSAVIASIFMAGPALASPTIEPIYPRAFYIMAVQPSWPLHSDFVAAANMGLLLGLPNQNATCKETGCQVEKNRATFYIEDSSLYLYSDDKKPQMVFVDRSGMGT